MRVSDLKERYEEFHKTASLQKRLIAKDDFTYHILLSVIDKYLQPHMKVLDIGCGVGTISLYVAGKSSKVVGIDISEKAVDVAQRSAKMLGIKNASFMAGNFLDAEFGGIFDFVICSEVLEHLSRDHGTLTKIRALTTRNGILFLTVPSVNSPIHRMRKYFLGVDVFDVKVGHLRRYAKTELITLLEKSGFAVVEVKLAEGLLRNFLFVTTVGSWLRIAANIPFLMHLIAVIDNVLVKRFGESQIIAIARKRWKT